MKKNSIKKNKNNNRSIKNQLNGGKPPILDWLWKKSDVPEIPLTMSFSPAKTFPKIKEFIRSTVIQPDHPLLKYTTHLFHFVNEYFQIISNTYYNLSSVSDMNQIYKSIIHDYNDVLDEHIYKSLASTYLTNQNKIIDEYLSSSQKLSFIPYLLASPNSVPESRFLKLINAGIDPILLDYARLHKFKIIINKEKKLVITCDNDPTQISLLEKFIDAVEQGVLTHIIIGLSYRDYKLIQYIELDPPKVIDIFKEPCELLPCYVITRENIVYKSYNSKLKDSQERSINAYYTNIYLRDKKGVIISHQMGTGKTILTISLIELEVIEYMRRNPTAKNKLKIVIVIPEGILGSWLEDFRKKCHINNNYNDNSRHRDDSVNSKNLCLNSNDNLCKIEIEAKGLSYYMYKQITSGTFESINPDTMKYTLEIYSYYQFSKIINSPETKNYFNQAIIILDEVHRLETERLRISQYIDSIGSKIPGLFMANRSNLTTDDFYDVNTVLLQYSNVYKAIRRGKRIIAITGTPIYNSLYDLLFLVNLVENNNKLLSFSKKDFNDKYGYRPMGTIINNLVGDIHKSLIGQLIFTFTMMMLKDAIGVRSLSKDVIWIITSTITAAGRAATSLGPVAGISLTQAVFFYVEQIWKGRLIHERNMTKTYKEELYLIKDTEQMRILISENFLYYNLNNDDNSKKNFAEIVEHDITHGCEYTKSQVIFFILSKYGVPISTFLKLYEYKMLNRVFTSSIEAIGNIEFEDILFDQNTLFVNEKSNNIREHGELVDDKYMNLVIGNLYFSRLFIDYAELIMWYNDIKDKPEKAEKASEIKGQINTTLTDMILEENNKQNIEWSGKFHTMMGYLKDAVSIDEKSMIYSNFTSVGTELFKDFYIHNCQSYGLTTDMILYLEDPSNPNNNNTDILKKFNQYHNNPKKIIVFHPDIMEGVSLQDCMHVHIMEYIPLKAKYDQVVARARRLNSHLNTMTYKSILNPKVHVYRYICTSFGWVQHGSNLFGSLFSKKYMRLNKLAVDSYHFLTSHSDAGVTNTSDQNAQKKFNCLNENDTILKDLLNKYAMDSTI